MSNEQRVGCLPTDTIVPNPEGTTTGVLVTFEQTPIAFEYLRNAVQIGLNLVEVVDPTQAPNYAINSTCLRFPSIALSTAPLSEVQQIILLSTSTCESLRSLTSGLLCGQVGRPTLRAESD